MDDVLAEDIPKLLQRFPQESNHKPSNPFDDDSGSNPFEDMPTADETEKWKQQFAELNPANGKVSGKAVRPLMEKTNLAKEILKEIWLLADEDKDGQLTEEEFIHCMQLLSQTVMGVPLPSANNNTDKVHYQ